MQRTNSLKSWMDASASVIVVMSMLLAPLSTLFAPMEVKAAAPVTFAISITNINGSSQPFSFTCDSNPLENPVSISGQGSASGNAVPGQMSQYAVKVDWEAQTVDEEAGSIQDGLGTFTGTDKNFTFTFSAGPYNYSTGGAKQIKVVLYHSTGSGNDGTIDQTATVDVCIDLDANNAPVADDLVTSVDEDSALNNTITATDPDGDSLTYAMDTTTTNGALTLNADGTFTYTPNANFNGSDSFTFIVSDGSLTDTGAVTITVNAVNDAPTITLNGSATMNLVVGDTFTDPGATGDDVEDGSLTPTVDGSVDTSTPGTYTLTYTVTDTNEASVSTTRTVIVSAAPVENTEELCSDEIDNDGDEKTDLADEDCGPFAPSPTEDTEALCKDGIDNDGDSLIDLDDSDCAAFVTPPTPPAPPAPSGGGGGNGPIVGSFPSGVVLGASTVAPGIQTQGSVLGASTQAPSSCTALISTYLRMGRDNNPEEVKKLQQFLNDQMNAGLPVTGFFGPLTHKAVEEFQLKYAAEILDPWQPFGLSANTPTGYVYKTTQRWINKMHCASLEIPMPQLP